jgi:hypothetical protein
MMLAFAAALALAVAVAGAAGCLRAAFALRQAFRGFHVRCRCQGRRRDGDDAGQRLAA